MTYQVLARKWRPHNFSEMVGQRHVLRALENALQAERLHHAYLFTGTRGVGKTTVARILAKCLNCETGITATPCGTCPSCEEINNGRFVDLLEVDAASRTRIEDTRELLDNVQYAPTRGRFKVYLIDEVHMLSGHSFNALLKTLEEPPPHVKFLLATTDPQKLPITVLSRCLQFNLKRLSTKQIQGHLDYLLQQEKLSFDSEALPFLAQAADGSMRDALSLLDQAIAYGAGTVKIDDVRHMLGDINHEQIFAILEAISAGEGKQVLNLVNDLAEHTPDFERAADHLLSLLHHIAIKQVVLDAEENDPRVISFAQQLAPEDVQLYYQIALHGRRDLPLSPDLRAGFEMLLLRMLAFRPVTTEIAISDTQAAATSVNAATQPVDKKKSPERQIAVAEHAARHPNTCLHSETPPRDIATKAKPVVPISTADEPPTIEAPPFGLAQTPQDSASHIHEPSDSVYNNTYGTTSNSNTSVTTSATTSANVNTEVIEPYAEIEQVATNDAHKQAVYSDYSEANPNVHHTEATLDWAKLIPKLNLSAVVLQLARHCVLQSYTRNRLELLLDQNAESLRQTKREDTLQSVLSEYFGKTITLRITTGRPTSKTPAQLIEIEAQRLQAQAEASIREDPFIMALEEHFDARVLASSIKRKNS